MGEEIEVGCARPTGGPVGEPVETDEKNDDKKIKEEPRMIRVGQKAPGQICLSQVIRIPREMGCVVFLSG